MLIATCHFTATTYVQYIDSLSSDCAQSPQYLTDLSVGLSTNIYNTNMHNATVTITAGY